MKAKKRAEGAGQLLFGEAAISAIVILQNVISILTFSMASENPLRNFPIFIIATKLIQKIYAQNNWLIRISLKG